MDQESRSRAYPGVVTEELVFGLERSEAAAWGDLYRDVPAAVSSACGIASLETGSALAVTAAKVDVLAFNRVLRFGVNEPVQKDVPDRLIAHYHRAGVPRFFIQVSPLAAPHGLCAELEDRGLRPYNNWVKLYRDTESPRRAETDLHIERIGAEHREAFGLIAATCLGWPEPVVPWIAALVGRPGWLHYMAFDGDRPAATAALHVRDGFGWIDFAATLAEYRGRGAQGALTERRIRDARELGCAWLGVETAEDKPDHPSPSYRNMVRYGFRLAYRRPNYIGGPAGA